MHPPRLFQPDQEYSLFTQESILEAA